MALSKNIKFFIPHRLLGNWYNFFFYHIKLLIIKLKLDSTWNYSSFAYNMAGQDYPRIIISGPLKDYKNGRYPIVSFNTLLVMNKEFVGIMQLEMKISYFYYEIFKSKLKNTQIFKN